ncbi:RNA-directed DNA polymerase from mobile element jockey [Caerostris extrusa]|uniref:RNA-directed DNA polymerase from mobile element jockey n=1 Tax=Caerostris extrusa TaxID=172846 RepID=A0AAV4RLA8_CAEEX|nr:RNA-directed DNA polymerase from mobile element jockey [Caerostris extrusa]
MLPQEQYGFRKGHSTIDQILYFVQRVRDAHNMKPSRHTMAVFLDLTKAFDKVWKNKLLGKCFSEFDIKVGADAGTPQDHLYCSYKANPEYGYQVAANINLKKLERIQFSAARIITGLRHSCPNDIACYEADLPPLLEKRNKYGEVRCKAEKF